MERRTLLKCFLFIAGGTAILPSCREPESKSSLLLKNMNISLEEERTLAEFAESLIPASATPGAKDAYTHLYTLRMLDDCYEKKEQQTFTKGLKAVEGMMKEAHKTSFLKATAAQRADILTLLEAKKGSDDAQGFYNLMKNLTIQGYLTSKPVMAGIFNYQLVPGKYEGAFPVKTIIRQA